MQARPIKTLSINKLSKTHIALTSQHNKKGFREISKAFLSGVTGNRTRDTRIFSPLLYQLSYDTSFVLKNYPIFRLGMQR